MWNSRKKDEEAAARAAATPAQSDYGREAIPTSSYSARPGDFATTRAVATIGKSLIVKGQIRGQEDLIIDGRLEGDVELPEHRLTIGVTGQVQGSVKAREIVILGTVQGNLEASERVEIKKNAKVIGDLKAQRPVIEDEAYFKGNVETIRVDVKPVPKPAAPPVVAPAAEAQASLVIDHKPEIRKG
jgi:cytoskeletal protein CcmA (bactofilin family)